LQGGRAADAEDVAGACCVFPELVSKSYFGVCFPSISLAKLHTFHKTHSMSPSQNNQIARNDSNTTVSTVQTHVRESSKVPNETLDHIFAQVPVEYRVRLRTISKARKNFIDKIGFHVDPVFVRDTLDNSGDQVPFYPAHISIRVNPVVDNERHLGVGTYLKCPDLGVRLGHYARDPWFMQNCQEDHAGIFQHQDEFITSPPITVIAIGTVEAPESSTLRVADGIRVRHLLHRSKDLTDSSGIMPGYLLKCKQNELLNWVLGYFAMCKSDAVGAPMLEKAKASETASVLGRSDQVVGDHDQREVLRKTGVSVHIRPVCPLLLNGL
jgi:hypothetical protein